MSSFRGAEVKINQKTMSSFRRSEVKLNQLKASFLVSHLKPIKRLKINGKNVDSYQTQHKENSLKSAQEIPTERSFPKKIIFCFRRFLFASFICLRFTTDWLPVSILRNLIELFSTNLVRRLLQSEHSQSKQIISFP